MFNNAGIVIMDLAERHELADWDRIIDINVRGVVNGVAAAYPRMLGQGFGHIVNTASIAGILPCPLEAGYPTTKHAIVGLTRALRVGAPAEGSARPHSAPARSAHGSAPREPSAACPNSSQTRRARSGRRRSG